MAETYPYEHLDGRRFQRLAQCLIVAENPRTQCFPLSGPDGGRDAVGMIDERESLTDALIYQVKFREPTPMGTPTSDELFQWVTSNIKRELPKIDQLRRHGAKEYVFITNVAASGHPGGGLRDRMQNWAEDNIPLPTFFWWRDDLDVRVGNNPHIAFKFMLFDGPSSVAAYFERAIPNSTFSRDSEFIGVSKKSPAVSALLMYLSDQYDEESVLRFKQADLDSTPLLDFFVDVQASPRSMRRSGNPQRMRDAYQQVSERAHHAREDSNRDGRLFYWWDSEAIGAAELFLHGGAFEEMSKVVLEGAPGQGKSTLTQFIGQVHRALILNKTEEISKLPRWTRAVDVKLPIRVELRRLATWLQGRSPWTRNAKGRVAPLIQSLEAFIVDHIQHVTEGLSFTINDLVSIVSETPTLLLLDGLDEVADTNLRQMVVECAERFIKKLSAVGADLQVVVTSRPIAFAKSPAFTPEEYTYFGLGDLSTELIQEYTNAWIKVRSVPQDQAEELRSILSESLGQSHVADLARNPMQLAILIWLVYVKGWSLPDKRTALYEAYMSTFLDREADKSSVVRQYRDVLMQLHGYLGWVLHARSEVGTSQDAAGDVAEDELRDLLKAYLEAQDRPTDLVDKLFHGVERVFVLVARVQGRFEFEVQPLREFFAARYLYKTSPHSTSAFPASGTRPERLEALIRNPYWLNVARFFCGWYDEGELADLSRRIEDLCSDSTYRDTAHPSRLIWRLLGDYVTTASPRDTKQLASLLTTPLHFRLLLNESEVMQSMRVRGQRVLPPDSGLPILVEHAQSVVAGEYSDELVHESSRLISTQGKRKDRFEWWYAQLPSVSLGREEWFRRGELTGSLMGVSSSELAEKLDPSSFSHTIWRTFATAGRLDVAVKDTFWISEYMTALGTGVYPSLPVTHAPRGPLASLSRIVSTLTRPEHIEGRYTITGGVVDQIDPAQYPNAQEEITALVRLVAGCLSGPPSYGISMTRVSKIAEALRATFGNCWAAWRVALVAGRAPSNDGDLPLSFLDEGATMAHRVKSAWRNKDSVEFWQDALSVTKSDGTTLAALSCLLEVGKMEVIGAVEPLISERWSELQYWQLEALNSYLAPSRFKSRSNLPKISLDALAGGWENIPSGFTALLRPRVKVKDISLLSAAVAAGVQDERSVPFVSAFMVSTNLKWMAMRSDWTGRIEGIREYFPKAAHTSMSSWSLPQQDLTRFPNRFTPEIAKGILSSPNSYPAVLLMAAEASVSGRATIAIPSLGDVARDGEWFSMR
ncbi:NACHT domain-containing protein [Streptomyces microflavus]|uniref:NACHT domain-containing protein n=1 Tax=Streptomyces microflavus TaxID=1919 RepID=UPI00366384E2